jgi:hypothetical protein
VGGQQRWLHAHDPVSDRRVVVDPLNEQASFDEHVGTEAVGTRWQQQELVKGRWYLQTTAGLLLWGIGKDTDAEDVDGGKMTGEIGKHNGIGPERNGEDYNAREY